MSNEEEILKELRKISKILIWSNGDRIISNLEKYATTLERKKIWTLIDGKRQANDLPRSSGLRKEA